MLDLGTRLQLLVGKHVPLPASSEVVDALRSAEIRVSDEGRDGFQITFSIGRDTLLGSRLLTLGLLEPMTRVIVMVIHEGRPHVLMDGLVTDHQVTASNQPGGSQLHVTGVDIGLQLDLEEKSRTWPNQADFMIVTQILAEYAQYGIVPQVTPTADYPIEMLRIPSQHGTDLEYILHLARRNGFSFHLELTPAPGVIRAYWGPAPRLGAPQRALSMNMGPFTNVEQPLHFEYDAMRGTEPQLFVADPILGMRIPIPLPSLTLVPLAAKPSPALRKTLPRDTAGASTPEAIARAVTELASGTNALEATGEVDLARYGAILKPRALVGVRGAGFDFDGFWYTREVTYRITRDGFKQSFKLSREGRGALLPLVVP